MGNRWQKDYYYRKAKEMRYRSRAAFKLKQLNERFRLMREGDVVLDLGAAPGGWMQIASEAVGESGLVVGVDLVEIEPFNSENMVCLKGDIRDEKVIGMLREVCESYDVVLSDASPDISGAWSLDHYNSVELARRALEIARMLLREGGSFLVKVFQGALIREYAMEVRREFEYMKIAKPKASRSRSAEVYMVGKRLLRTPVKYGDVVTLELRESRAGVGVGEIKGLQVLVRGGRAGERVKARIKKVTKDRAFGVKL